MRRRLASGFCGSLVLAMFCCNLPAATAPATRLAAGLFVRVSLASPAERPWRVHVVAQLPGGKSKGTYVGRTVAAAGKDVEFLPAGQSTGWVDLSDALTTRGATVRFLFETQPALDDAGVKARVDVASAADGSAILRSVTDHDPGNVISVRIGPALSPSKGANPAKASDKILSIREDAQRRLDEVRSWNLPAGPLPRKLWCMTGFRSNGEFYTDPAIAEMDFDTIRLLGMNGYWEQNGGQPGPLRGMAHARGMDRSTVYWRAVESLPRDKDGAVRLDWNALDAFLDKAYRGAIASTRARHPGGMPDVIADLMDEPAGFRFAGPEYDREFHDYLQGQSLSPGFFGKEAWGQVNPISLGWRTYFRQRAEIDSADETARRLFYWSARFWNHATARVYAMATGKVEQYAPGTPTRVNFGPPWWYDYGTLPRGIDAFEFGRLRGVTMGFNEDWVGAGSARVPLEIDSLLMDWSRAAARPGTPLLGSYITRDADRATVKLRTFACLAREAKVFDFYYYGPAYTFFDDWSDNASMARGVAEVTRDLGAADDVLWEGRTTRAEAALLYSQSWPVWKTDDTEQCEQVMAYIALLHAGIPVDIVSDAEVADGRFAARGYKCLYVVNESVPATAAAAIERWVGDGGHLWASGWAAMRDEYNSPTRAWDAMLGLRSRSWETPAAASGAKPALIRPDDWKRPMADREVSVKPAEGAELQYLDIAGHEHKAYQVKHGSGVVRLVPWTAGKAYMDGAAERAGSLAKAEVFPDDARRRVYADFATDAGARPPTVTSVSQVLAWPLRAQRKGVVLLANYTGEPARDVVVTVLAPIPVSKARSLRHGDLPFTRPDPEHIRLTIPVDDVTDMIMLE